jgi:hypothetical protein
MLSPGVRKLALTAHVVSSVGWLGSVAGFLALSIAGVTSSSATTVRSAFVAMNLIGQFMIVPLSLLALLTGLIQALGTHWGLFRHYWVLTKFALTVAATTLLLMHQFTAVSEAAKQASAASGLPDVGPLGTQLVFDAAAAIVVLLTTTTLSVFKPWGKTGYGGRVGEMPLGLRIFLTIVGAIVAGILIVHLAGGGMGHAPLPSGLFAK